MAEIDTLVLDKLLAFIRKLDQSGIHVSQAYLFGSHAQGTADKWSDIDIAVISRQIGNDRLEERIRLTRLAFEIDDRIEPLPFNADGFSEDDPLVREIKRNGVALR